MRWKTVLALLVALGLMTLTLIPAAQAGAVGGPKIRRNTVVRGYATDTYVVRFTGGETALILVSGDGDTDLDLYVYDENGKLIASDEDDTDDCAVRWTPRWTGPFTIRVVNRGGVANLYSIVTN